MAGGPFVLLLSAGSNRAWQCREGVVNFSWHHHALFLLAVQALPQLPERQVGPRVKRLPLRSVLLLLLLLLLLLPPLLPLPPLLLHCGSAPCPLASRFHCASLCLSFGQGGLLKPN